MGYVPTVLFIILGVALFVRFRMVYHDENVSNLLSKKEALSQARTAVERLTGIRVTDWKVYASFWRDGATINEINYAGLLDELRPVLSQWGLMAAWRFRFFGPNVSILVGIGPSGEIIEYRIENQNINTETDIADKKPDIKDVLEILRNGVTDGRWNRAVPIGEGSFDDSSEQIATIWYLIEAPKFRLRVSLRFRNSILVDMSSEPQIYLEDEKAATSRKAWDAVLRVLGTLGTLLAGVTSVVVIVGSGAHITWELGGILGAIILFAEFITVRDGYQRALVNAFDPRISRGMMKWITIGSTILKGITSAVVVFVAVSAGCIAAQHNGIHVYHQPMTSDVVYGASYGIVILGIFTFGKYILARIGRLRLVEELPDKVVSMGVYKIREVLSLSLQSAIGEEATVRLLAFSTILWGTHHFWVSTMLSSLFWAFMHSSDGIFPPYVRWIEVALLGVCITLVYIHYGFIAAIAAHFIYNFALMATPLFKGQMQKKLATLTSRNVN